MARQTNGLRTAVLVEGCRIPFLRSNTEYKDLMAYDLARMAIKGLLSKTQLEPEQVQWVIMGNVIANYTTSNVAREAALAAGIPQRVPAFTVTLACVSANRAITSGVELIQTGQADVVIAGGTESLSDVPIRFRKRFRQKLIEAQKYRRPLEYLKFLKGLRLKDLLPEVPAIAEFSTGRTMGQDCDRMAGKFGVTRREQDEFALRSHHLAAKATEEGLLKDEVIPAYVPPEFRVVEKDNGIRGDSTLEKLSQLRPAFVKPYGTLTAGNSSYLTDGAAAVLLMAEETARALGYSPKARFVSYAYTAQDPQEELLLGPAYATPKALDAAGLTLKDIDVFEFHEAFAAQVLANLKCLNSDEFAREHLGREKRVGEVPLEKLNTWGGSLSLGHPFGATGARLVTTAANRLIKEDGQFALVASCAAGAVGNAIILERYE
ncbi:MAG: acetyl-CoA C-acyltransferase [Calditrichaeota bacterium]|nr:MAG: acetyl-CoA C-acyltransferase [Calditrichota bacterium]